MCAGSVASGRCILSIFCKQILDIWWLNLSFDMLGASTFASWETLWRSCGNPVPILWDRNVHDPTTVRDVGVLPQISAVCELEWNVF